MNSKLALATAAAVMGAASAYAESAAMCFDPAARQAYESCPSGPKDLKAGGTRSSVNLSTVAPAQDPKKKDALTRPGNPNMSFGEGGRDDRKSRLQARGLALLVGEIGSLEQLFKTTPKTSPERAPLARRIAESYVELEAAAFRDKTTAEVDRDTLKKTNPAEASKKQAQVQQSDTIMKKARISAISYYKVLTEQYATYSQLDEVLYYLAYEYEQAGDNDNARKVYAQLIHDRPNSKYVPNAYLAFAELFFNESQGDPSKWDTSRKAYEEVLKYKPETNKVYGYAMYKLAYVHWNMGAYDKAIETFKRTIEYGVTYSQQPGASKYAESSRHDIIPVYALQGKPEMAYNFFHGLSGDKVGESSKTIGMLEELGQNYLDTGHYADAIVTFRDLIVRDKEGAKLCQYQVSITEATMAMKANAKDVIKNELDNQVKAYQAFNKSSQPAAAKQVCASKTAALITETAMAWHVEAVGHPPKERGTSDPKTMALAAKLYKEVVETWTPDEFKTFEFPRLAKDAWPSIYRIKYNMADLLWVQQDWEKCGPAFDVIVAEDPNSADASDAALAAVLCYQNQFKKVYSREALRKEASTLRGNDKETTVDEAKKLEPKEYTDSQKGMITAMSRYVCSIKPAAGDADGLKQMAEIKFERARMYYGAQHWQEAALAFRDIATNYSTDEYGLMAAQYELEALNILALKVNPARSACIGEMQADVPKYVDNYCGPKSGAQKDSETCTNLSKVKVDLERMKCQATVKEAGTAPPAKAVELYTQGGACYMALFTPYCAEPAANKKAPLAEKCDEIAYNGAKAYQAGRLLAKSIQARRALIDFDNATKGKGSGSPLARKAVYEIGGNYQAMAVYDQAADWYEKFAAADPSDEKASNALSDAVVLRLGLGQEFEALKDYDTFRRLYGAKKKTQTAQIALALGANYADKKDYDKAKKQLVGSMGVIDGAAPDVALQAHATLGRVLRELKGGDRQAVGEYAKVLKIWADGDSATKKIKEAYPDEDPATNNRRLGRALNAVGEAMFFDAEMKKVALVDSLKFPVYYGNGSRESVSKHIKDKVGPWAIKKSDAIKKVAPDYEKILALKPDAPPKWVIAAGSRVGLMWGQYVDEFRAAPIPEGMKKDRELRNAYYGSLDDVSAPYKDKLAKPALKTCLDYSVKYQYFDDYSRSCEVWLSKNYKAEYHVVDELRGTANLANSALGEQNPPVMIGGAFYHASTGPVDAPKDDAKKPEPAKKAVPAPKRTGR